MPDLPPGPGPRPRPVDHRGPLSRRQRIGLVAGAVLVAVVASATTTWGLVTFSDVPATNPFRSNISNVAGAGIAQGYADGTYRPAEPVSRQAMAAFLNRGLGRVGYGVQNVPVLTNYDLPEQTLVDVTVRAGAEGTGGGFVLLSADGIAALTSDAASPRSVHLTIEDLTTGLTSAPGVETVGPAAYEYRSLSTQWVVALPAGATRTFRLIADGTGSTQTVRVTGSLSALYVPFGPDGNNTLAFELPPPP